MAHDEEFMAMCRQYAEARSEGKMPSKMLNALYEACMNKGKSLDMTRYAIEEAIEQCLEERMI